jgi:hypothetical protein
MVTIAEHLPPEVQAQLERLLDIRKRVLAEKEKAVTPAVWSALRLADIYLFLALSHLGYMEEFFPSQQEVAP